MVKQFPKYYYWWNFQMMLREIFLKKFPMKFAKFDKISKAISKKIHKLISKSITELFPNGLWEELLNKFIIKSPKKSKGNCRRNLLENCQKNFLRNCWRIFHRNCRMNSLEQIPKKFLKKLNRRNNANKFWKKFY